MLATRLQGIPPTIFSQMSALAMRTQSVNLGQGFPDVDGPPSVIARAAAALEGGHNQYAPGLGVPALRQAIARHQLRHYGIELDPDSQVVVTTGATEGIASRNAPSLKGSMSSESLQAVARQVDAQL